MSREPFSIKRLFDIDYARKAFFLLYQKQEESERAGQKFDGMSFNDWAVASTKTYGMTRSLFIEYIAAMEILRLVQQNPSKTRFTVTDSGYKTANVLLEAEENLRSIDTEDYELVKKVRAAEKETTRVPLEKHSRNL